MLILGIDPGTATTGYGVLEVKNKGYKALKFGLIETDSNGTPSKRLVNIHRQLSKIIKEYKPEILSIEKLFFATNRKTAMRVSQAVGVILFTAAKTNTKVVEYAPGTIKKIVAGDGRADKKKVQKEVRKHLGPQIKSRAHKKTHFDNEADAIAVALCHAMQLNGKAK
jgi:crossover junction endodeoxyribonuclease RuvC